MDDIMAIFKQAQQYLKSAGIDQWQNGYPNPDVIRADIAKDISYVVTNDDEIVATAAIFFDIEHTYDRITEGKWQSDDAYCTIHRIAVKDELKGRSIGAFIIDCAEHMCFKRSIGSIRADTHRDNKPMQKMLTKKGFTYCGIIYLADGKERFAYEKILGGLI
jgi:GNAT superfamily N-acetyltransferase